MVLKDKFQFKYKLWMKEEGWSPFPFPYSGPIAQGKGGTEKNDENIPLICFPSHKSAAKRQKALFAP
jgi:hypothetical protein